MYYRAEGLQEKLAWLQSRGLSRGAVAQMVSRMPQLLSIRVDRMAPKLDYLLRVMGLPVEELLACPAFLAMSLQDRCAGPQPPAGSPPPGSAALEESRAALHSHGCESAGTAGAAGRRGGLRVTQSMWGARQGSVRGGSLRQVPLRHPGRIYQQF